MSAKILSQPTATPATVSAAGHRSPADKAVIARIVRRERRARDYGVGYGSSSGYASGKRYAENWGNPRFICG